MQGSVRKMVCEDDLVATRLRMEVQKKLSSLNKAIKLTNRPTDRVPRQTPLLGPLHVLL